MECPKCGFEQEATNPECIACGVIFSRFQERQEAGFVAPAGDTLYSGPAGADTMYSGPPPGQAMYSGDPAAGMPGSGVSTALEDAKLLKRPSIFTIYAWIHGLSGVLVALAMVAIGLMGGGKGIVLGGMLLAAFLVFFAMGIAAMSKWAWWVLLLTSILGLAALPLGPIYNAFFIVFLLKSGTKVLFSDKRPSELAPKERADVVELSRSNWNKGLVIGFWFVLFSPLVFFFGANFDVITGVRKQMSTMNSMAQIRDQLRVYGAREGNFPGSRNIEALESELRKRGGGFEMPLDGWGNEFKYVRTRRGFQIISPGRDGEFERTSYKEETTSSFDCDIVYSSTGWVRYTDPRQ